MSNSDIKIVVASTKEYRMPKGSIYLPMFLGSVYHTEDEKKRMAELGFICDDTLDNISEKNDKYCELTGLYWIWKNGDSDYKGLCHYRRLLGSKNKKGHVIGREELLEIVEFCKVVLPKKRRYYIETLYTHYEHTHDGKQLNLTRQVIETRCPEYVQVFEETVRQTGGYMFNIMVLRRDMLDEYCGWLFPILSDLEYLVDDTEMSKFDRRYAGRVSEILFNVWLNKKIKDGRISKKEICELPVVYTEGEKMIKKALKFLRAKFLRKKYS